MQNVRSGNSHYLMGVDGRLNSSGVICGAVTFRAHCLHIYHVHSVERGPLLDHQGLVRSNRRERA